MSSQSPRRHVAGVLIVATVASLAFGSLVLFGTDTSALAIVPGTTETHCLVLALADTGASR